MAVLCEYDALPEIGHACGHNLIAEAGAGAALGIKAAMEFAKKHGHSLGKVIGIHVHLSLRSGSINPVYLRLNPYSAGIDFIRQNLTSVDVRF